MTTGIAFLLATFLSPLVAVVPYEAATPALVIVGFLMMMEVAGIQWKNYEIAIGKIREIHPLMAVTGVLFVVYFALEPIKTLLGV